MTFAQRRKGLTMHFSERIPVVKRRTYVSEKWCLYFNSAVATLLQSV